MGRVTGWTAERENDEEVFTHFASGTVRDGAKGGRVVGESNAWRAREYECEYDCWYE